MLEVAKLGKRHQQTIANIVTVLCSYADLLRSDKFAFE